MCLFFYLAPRHEGVLGEWRYSGTRWGEWSSSRPVRLTPRNRAPGTHWIGGWVGPRAVLEAVVKRKIPSPHRKSNPRTPIVQPVAVMLNINCKILIKLQASERLERIFSLIVYIYQEFLSKIDSFSYKSEPDLCELESHHWRLIVHVTCEHSRQTFRVKKENNEFRILEVNMHHCFLARPVGWEILHDVSKEYNNFLEVGRDLLILFWYFTAVCHHWGLNVFECDAIRWFWMVNVGSGKDKFLFVKCTLDILCFLMHTKCNIYK
jgi:hypothetical protein